ncbi:MAG: hypothetical protein J0L93_09855 [Deltaproteobacteria bacterium]|nr:hypothetical protein [Deltaproteobacteria bacterium]
MKIKPKHLNKGQTMMEYIILVALLAIASIPVAKVLGDVFRNHMMRSADAMVNGRTRDYHDRGRELIREGANKVKRDMNNFDD